MRQRRLVGLSRSYGLRLIGPNALGIINTDPDVSLNASLSSVMPPRGRAGLLLPVRRARLGDPGEGPEPRPGPHDLRQRRQPRRRLGQRPPAVLGGGRRHRGRPALPRVHRQPAQVLPHRAPGEPAQADRRGALRAQLAGRADGPRGPQDRRARARPSTRCSARPAIIQVESLEEMFDVAQLLAHQPLPRGRRVAIVGNSDALGLLAADAANSRRPGGQPAGGAGRRRDRGGLRGRARRRHRRPRGRRGGRDLHPAAQRRPAPARTSPTCSPRSASSPTSRSCRPSSAPRACPSCCACPTWPAPAPGAARCRRTPRSRPPCARSPTSWSTPCGCGSRSRRSATCRPTTATTPATSSTRCSCATRRAGTSTSSSSTACSAPTASTCGTPTPVATLDEAVAAGESLGWDVVLKATADHLRDRPDLAHVWRNIDTPEEMRDAWRLAQPGHRPSPSAPASSCSERPARGAGRASRSMEDPLFGPGAVLRHRRSAHRLLGDRSFRIPPLAEHDAQDMVREIKASPLLFGYRGARSSTWSRSSGSYAAWRRSRTTCREVRALELPLVLAGALGRVGARGSARIEPVLDPRSDWFVRRLSTPARRHAAGLSGPRDRMRAMRTAEARRGSAPATRQRPHRLLPRGGDRRRLRGGGRRGRVSFFVHHEPTFDRDEVRRHLTVLRADADAADPRATPTSTPATTCCPSPTPRPRPRRSRSRRCAPWWSPGWSANPTLGPSPRRPRPC